MAFQNCPTCISFSAMWFYVCKDAKAPSQLASRDNCRYLCMLRGPKGFEGLGVGDSLHRHFQRKHEDS